MTLSESAFKGPRNFFRLRCSDFSLLLRFSELEGPPQNNRIINSLTRIQSQYFNKFLQPNRCAFFGKFGKKVNNYENVRLLVPFRILLPSILARNSFINFKFEQESDARKKRFSFSNVSLSLEKIAKTSRINIVTFYNLSLWMLSRTYCLKYFFSSNFQN